MGKFEQQENMVGLADYNDISLRKKTLQNRLFCKMIELFWGKTKLIFKGRLFS